MSGHSRIDRDTSRSFEDRTIPEGEFVGYIDELLRKHLPDRSVPWPASPPPAWARGFTPRTILDLGCGVGGFTRALLTRLGEWGCLSHLEQVVLVESDTTIVHGGGEKLRSHLTSTVTDVLSSFGRSEATVQVILEEIKLCPENNKHAPAAIPLLEPYRNSIDLIIASHLTYYFDDGAGHELINSLSQHTLSSAGLVWCVIRKRQCPIYLTRAAVLRRSGEQEMKPFDYAEYFESKVLPTLPNVILVEGKDQVFLEGNDVTESRDVAYYLMWREPPAGDWSLPHARAVTELLEQRGPLFKERHFILGGANDKQQI